MAPAPENYDKQLLTRQIKEQARAEGFDNVGVARAEPLTLEAEYLQDWLARQYHGTMAWLARDPDKRIDPRKIYPDAQSVIVTTQNYYTSHQHSDSAATGKISRYAWGDDYHVVVADKLRALLAFIQTEVPGSAGKVCVDIQPMMDKAWAVRAGLGWIGKHSNLITTQHGSWVFIGELLLNVELEFDS